MAGLANAGTYQVVVSNAFGVALSSNAVLTVGMNPSQPPQITTQPQGTNVVVGAEVTFTVTATGSTPLLYQWFKNGLGGRIAGATNHFYDIPSVSSGDAGTYQVGVSNALGMVFSSNAVLTISP